MRTTTLLTLCLLLLGFTACRTTLPEAPAKASGRIDTYPGPEDLVLQRLTGEARLIVSCDQRREGAEDLGGFMSVDLATGRATPMEVIGLPKEVKLHPHGIDLSYNSKGIPYLYAINHEVVGKEKVNRVLKFQVERQHLRFEAMYEDEKLVSPNDLAALPDGSFYVTNDSKRRSIGLGWLFEKMFKARTSKIAYRSVEGQWSFVGDKKLAYANGIIASNKRVVVACTQKKDLVIYNRDPNTGQLTQARNIRQIVGMDNIDAINDSLVLIAAHPSSWAFLKHAKKTENRSPGITWLVNLNSGEVKPIYATDGQEISANSVSVYFGGKLYIGQVFDPYLLVVDVPAATW